MMAPLCGSWPLLNRATSQRSLGRPLGNEELKYIRQANIMVSRCCFIIEVCAALVIMWMLEHPASSILFAHPRMQSLIARGLMYQISFEMDDFGALSAKPTKLYASHAFFNELPLHLPEGYRHPEFRAGNALCTQHIDLDGTVRTTGDPEELKRSQSYAAGFARALARVVLDHKEDVIGAYRRRHGAVRLDSVCHSDVESILQTDGADWQAALCADVLAFAQGRIPEDEEVLRQAACQCKFCLREDVRWRSSH